MEELYLYHHMGLGDNIICNGMVRELYKSYDKIHIFCFKVYLENVKQMYLDINVELFPIDLDGEYVIEPFIRNNKIKNFKKIGFGDLQLSDVNADNFDMQFYKLAGIVFNKKWDNFYMERNIDKEKFVFNELGLNENEYVFVHDDIDRGFKIKEDLLPKNIKIIRPLKTYGLFDYSYIIENAKEIHLMESSYKCLVEHLNLKTNNLYYHTYVRNYPKNIRVSSKYNWIEY